ncbi:hypothetical protein VB715_06150 [Crocosphaera sp. UHCC 0190]|uniref:hypothetical protein n=1 Tax=Crocosphaera sp. UHCC 0190 TaxID=3110246 RepID=UPI002B1F3567|nr:hypothetical protein [Crocosphaera sp. UHCC 0190]MEA5509343.1 hypothetical protein [Crocosphaera sp. UHCC 0190]
MPLTLASRACSNVIVNQIVIPIKPLCGDDKFLPSPETRYAWYLAHYGTSNPLELDSELVIASIEQLALWWVMMKSEVN